MTNISHAATPTPSRSLATVAIALAVTSALCLAALHALSAEIDPSWHMVSEYAYGAYGPLLRGFFFSWGFSGILTALALFPLGTRGWHRLGAALVFVSGVGAFAGGLFDIRHPLHGVAFGLGVPTLPIGALLLTGPLARRAPIARLLLQVSAHATWLSIVAMGATMGAFVASLKAAGAFHPESTQLLTSLPPGVTTVSGYANRLLVLAYLAWLAIAGSVVRHG